MRSVWDVWPVRLINAVVLVFIGWLAAHDTKTLTWSRLVLLVVVLFMVGVGMTFFWKSLRGYGAKSTEFGFIPPEQNPGFISKLFLWLATFGILAMSAIGAAGLLLFNQN